MTSAAIAAWYLVHKWTALVCTVFLVMLCVTGLPLIFHDEIDALFDTTPAMIPVLATLVWAWTRRR